MAAFAVTQPFRPAFGVQAKDTLGRRQFSHLLSSNSEEEETDFEPTWTYEPYDPAKANRNKFPQKRNPNRGPPRRPFSTWTVPKTVSIPEDKLEFSFVRASGSGGQNVNKLSTKVEIRFHVMQADWIPMEVRERLSTQQSNRINKEGYISITSQENRTQGMNRKAAIDKLKVMILEAWPRPKIRKQRKGISQGEKRRRKEFKKKRSETKSNRKKVDW
ncbi:MAG: hypothetical protein SGBAC_004644 [Bacillariaceae sp.]